MALNFAATLSPSKSSFHGGPLSQSTPNLSPFMIPSLPSRSPRANPLLIACKRLSGLEEAMKTQRGRQLQSVMKVRRRPPLRRGSVSSRLSIPDHIPSPLTSPHGIFPRLRARTMFTTLGELKSEHVERYGYRVAERFVGYGVGIIFHSQPISNHHRNEESGVMVENQTFTIEPILTMGSIECVTWPDNWTTLTADCGPAAQFEHTILITRRGGEILTKC